MSDVICIHVRGLEFYGYHGVPADERAIGHRYRVNLTLRLPARATETDRVEDTVDYAAAAKIALDIGTTEAFFTVERLASVIGDALLAEFPALVEVDVMVEKPMPPAPILAEAVGVTLTRRRA